MDNSPHGRLNSFLRFVGFQNASFLLFIFNFPCPVCWGRGSVCFDPRQVDCLAPARMLSACRDSSLCYLCSKLWAPSTFFRTTSRDHTLDSTWSTAGDGEGFVWGLYSVCVYRCMQGLGTWSSSLSPVSSPDEETRHSAALSLPQRRRALLPDLPSPPSLSLSLVFLFFFFYSLSRSACVDCVRRNETCECAGCTGGNCSTVSRLLKRPRRNSE